MNSGNASSPASERITGFHRNSLATHGHRASSLVPMRALILDHADAPFREVTLERPVPKAGEVLVRIHASGVNPLDLKIRGGHAAHARHPFPAILGLDLAGIIEEP